jgi:hypothetical protein
MNYELALPSLGGLGLAYERERAGAGHVPHGPPGFRSQRAAFLLLFAVCASKPMSPAARSCASAIAHQP